MYLTLKSSHPNLMYVVHFRTSYKSLCVLVPCFILHIILRAHLVIQYFKFFLVDVD